MYFSGRYSPYLNSMAKERVSKVALHLILTILFIAALYRSATSISVYTLLPIVFLLLCPSIAFLLYLNRHAKYAGYKVKSLLTGILLFNIFISYFCLQHNQSRYTLYKYLFGGVILRETVKSTNSDGEVHNVTYYDYEGPYSPTRTFVERNLLLLFFLSPVVVYVLVLSTDDRDYQDHGKHGRFEDN
jgi:hypothetical protein